MSLIAAALQIATVKALDGNIAAVVFDSKADPQRLQDEPLPVVIVCAIEGKRMVDGLGFFEAQQTVDLCLDLGVARKVVHQVQDGDATVSVEFPDNDAGHDLALHTLGYEILRALFATDNDWAIVWRALAARASAADPSLWERGASDDNGVRLALTRHIMRLEPMNEPAPGAQLSELWTALLGLMDADAELASIAKYWRALITEPGLPKWMQAVAEQGLTPDNAQAVDAGGAPLGTTAAADDAVPSTEIDATDSDDGGVLAVTVGGAAVAPAGGAPVTVPEQADD